MYAEFLSIIGSIAIFGLFLVGLLYCAKIFYVERLIKLWENKNNSHFIIFSDNNSAIKNYYNLNNLDDLEKLRGYFIKINENDPIDILIDTNGGEFIYHKYALDLLFCHKGNISVFVPRKAYSCGTIISLFAHKIYMHKFAHLSPIDLQIIFETCKTANKICIAANELVNMTASLSNSDLGNLLLLYSKHACKSVNISNILLSNFYTKRYDKNMLNIIQEHFITPNLPHVYAYSVDELKNFGFQILDLPNDILDIHSLIFP